MSNLKPRFVPLGDSALLVRFGERLDEAANRAAIGFALRLAENPPDGVEEITPNLVSVLLDFDPARTDATRLSAELRLLPPDAWLSESVDGATYHIPIVFDGEDLAEAADRLGLNASTFVSRHNAAPLRILASGFAPGFVYCGFHPRPLHLPRRTAVRASVPIGTVLFAAGQTAITATTIPTGWHVIGHTAFRNFDPAADPPTRLRPGDVVMFEAVA